MKNCVKSPKNRLNGKNRDIWSINDQFKGISFVGKLQKRVPNRIAENHIFSTWQSPKCKMQLENAWNILWKTKKITKNSVGKQWKYYLDIKPKHHVLWYTIFEHIMWISYKLSIFSRQNFNRKWPHPDIKKLLIDWKNIEVFENAKISPKKCRFNDEKSTFLYLTHVSYRDYIECVSHWTIRFFVQQQYIWQAFE